VIASDLLDNLSVTNSSSDAAADSLPVNRVFSTTSSSAPAGAQRGSDGVGSSSGFSATGAELPKPSSGLASWSFNGSSSPSGFAFGEGEGSSSGVVEAAAR
jgi:hypothetical protein